MASEPVDRKGVRRKKVNTMNGMGGSEVGSGGTYVKVLDGETLHGASGAVRGMDGHGVLVIGAAGAIGGGFVDAGPPPLADQVAQLVPTTRAPPRARGS